MAIRQVIAIALIGLSGLYAGHLRAGRAQSGALPDLAQLSRNPHGWWSEDVPASPEAERVLAADATLHRRYRREDGTEVWFYVAYFAQQQANSQIHSPRNCLPGGGWRIASLRQQSLAIRGHLQPVTRMQIAKDDYAQEVIYWFSTQGGRQAGEYALKLDLVKNSLAGRPTNAAFVRYNAQCADSTALAGLMDVLGADLDRILGNVGLR